LYYVCSRHLLTLSEVHVADLEQRVATLEREMSTVKDRVGLVEEDAKSIPDLIKLEFRLANSQIARLSHDVAELRDLPAKFDALHRVVAELVVEILADRDKKH